MSGVESRFRKIFKSLLKVILLGVLLLFVWIGTVLFGVFANQLSRDFKKEGYDAYLEKDYQTARKKLSSSAKEGDAEAQFLLGLAYMADGEDGSDFVTAAKWFRESAKQGNAHAQAMLGVLYQFGRGVQLDYIMAYKWYLISLSTDRKIIEEVAPDLRNFYNTLYKKLPTSQKIEANYLANKWRKENQ